MSPTRFLVYIIATSVSCFFAGMSCAFALVGMGVATP